MLLCSEETLSFGEKQRAGALAFPPSSAASPGGTSDLQPHGHGTKSHSMFSSVVINSCLRAPSFLSSSSATAVDLPCKAGQQRCPELKMGLLFRGFFRAGWDQGSAIAVPAQPRKRQSGQHPCGLRKLPSVRQRGTLVRSCVDHEDLTPWTWSR